VLREALAAVCALAGNADKIRHKNRKNPPRRRFGMLEL
jgi:hypothetical protein